MKNKILKYGSQSINNDDILSVSEVLKSDYLTTGPVSENFNKKLKDKLNVKYISTCSSGTAALHLSMLAIGLKKGDNVILPAINFIASINMCHNLGAKIYLADVDKYTGQMTPQTLEDCIKSNNIKKIRAVVTMYNGGSPLNFKEFYKLKKRYNFFLIEDACHALGAKYSIKKKYYVGNCKYSDIATFSLHPVKSITSGEGGIISTNNKNIFKKIELLKNHGIIRKKSTLMTYIWNYKVVVPGYNFRLSDISSALGLSQLNRLDKFIKTRNKNFKIYQKFLKKFHAYLNLPILVQDLLSANHLYIVNLNPKNLGLSRDKFIQELFKFKILCQVHYIPIFFHPYYKSLKNKNLKNSIEYFKNSFSLPMHVNLKKKDIIHICDCIEKIILKYKKN